MTSRLLLSLAAPALLLAQWKTVASLPSTPRGIAIDAAGRIHVSLADGVFRLGPKGRWALVFATGNGASGIAFDPLGRLILCETSDASRRHPRAIRVGPAGGRETLAEAFGGRALNGPRHAAVDGKARAFISDPPGSVLRIDDIGRGAQILTPPSVGSISGVALSPDARTIYVAYDREIRAFPLDADGNAGPRRDFHRLESGDAVNGLCADSAGFVYAATRTGLLKLSSEGRLIERRRVKGGAIACAVSAGGVIVATAAKLLRSR